MFGNPEVTRRQGAEVLCVRQDGYPAIESIKQGTEPSATELG